MVRMIYQLTMHKKALELHLAFKQLTIYLFGIIMDINIKDQIIIIKRP